MALYKFTYLLTRLIAPAVSTIHFGDKMKNGDAATNSLYFVLSFIMRPSSLGGGRILRRTLSVCPSVCPSVCLSVRPVSGCTLFTVAPSYERTCKIEKLRFSLMVQRHVCTFRHAQRAAYRTAISAAQILVLYSLNNYL